MDDGNRIFGVILSIISGAALIVYLFWGSYKEVIIYSSLSIIGVIVLGFVLVFFWSTAQENRRKREEEKIRLERAIEYEKWQKEQEEERVKRAESLKKEEAQKLEQERQKEKKTFNKSLFTVIDGKLSDRKNS